MCTEQLIHCIGTVQYLRQCSGILPVRGTVYFWSYRKGFPLGQWSRPETLGQRRRTAWFAGRRRGDMCGINANPQCRMSYLSARKPFSGHNGAKQPKSVAWRPNVMQMGVTSLWKRHTGIKFGRKSSASRVTQSMMRPCCSREKWTSAVQLWDI